MSTQRQQQNKQPFSNSTMPYQSHAIVTYRFDLICFLKCQQTMASIRLNNNVMPAMAPAVIINMSLGARFQSSGLQTG